MTDTGPHIYDTEGRLVWSGTKVLHGGLVSDFHTCDFRSHTSLCFFEGRRRQGWGQGQVVVLDSQYRSVVTVQGDAITGLADMHEFNLIDSGRKAIITAYDVEPFDATNLNLTGGFAWILNSYFKEIDVTSGEIIFEWNALEHFVPATQPSELSPPGTSRLAPLDFFHLNSVTKSLDGDYIISARHTSAIYKVSHVDGHVVWQLGGWMTDFEADFNFCHQHHALILHESPHKMILSMFDNGCTTNAETRSSAKTVELDMLDMTAVLLNEYGADANVAVKTQGSAQMLPSNGNVLVGWGSRSTITEYASNGTLVFNATLAGKAYTYRVYKSDWRGIPTEDPKIYSYARFRNASTVVYVSWNGATEVTHWRFFGRNSLAESFAFLGAIPKNGFETVFVSERHVEFSFAEAVSSDGKSLRKSAIQKTFIPSVELARFCTDLLCPWQSDRTPRASQDTRGYSPGLTELNAANWKQLWVCSCGLTIVAIIYILRRSFRNHVTTIRRCFRTKPKPILF